MRRLYPIGLLVLVSMACGESRRPGGPGVGGSTPRRDAAQVDAGEEGRNDGGPTQEGQDGEVSEGRDVTSEPGRDADPMVTPSDVGFPAFDAQPQPDAGFPRDVGFPPDLGFPTFPDAAQPRDTGVVTGNDASLPPLQTQVSAVPGTALAHLGTNDFDFSVTLQFDNAGPGAESLSVTSAELSIVIVSQTFALTPSSQLAPVGSSQRTFSKVPGSGNPPTLDSTLLLLACSGIGFPVSGVLTIGFSNGAVVSIIDTVISCGP